MKILFVVAVLLIAIEHQFHDSIPAFRPAEFSKGHTK